MFDESDLIFRPNLNSVQVTLKSIHSSDLGHHTSDLEKQSHLINKLHISKTFGYPLDVFDQSDF